MRRLSGEVVRLSAAILAGLSALLLTYSAMRSWNRDRSQTKAMLSVESFCTNEVAAWSAAITKATHPEAEDATWAESLDKELSANLTGIQSSVSGQGTVFCGFSTPLTGGKHYQLCLAPGFAPSGLRHGKPL